MASSGVGSKVPVALPKRDGPGSTSASTSAPLMPAEEALGLGIGSRIKVIHSSFPNTPIDGYLHTADAQFNWIILWNADWSDNPASSTSKPGTNSPNTSMSYPTPENPLPPAAGGIKIIPINSIQSFTLLEAPTEQTSSNTSYQPPSHTTTSQISTSAAQARLQRNLVLAQSHLASRGPKGTSPSDQALFDAPAKTMPARWEGSRMVVLEQFYVDKPYGSGNVTLVREGEGKGGLERIKKVLEFERVKAGLRMGQNTTTAVINGSGKKGG